MDVELVRARMFFPEDETGALQYFATCVTRWFDEVDPEYNLGLGFGRSIPRGDRSGSDLSVEARPERQDDRVHR